jgi:hypothetical protein
LSGRDVCVSDDTGGRYRGEEEVVGEVFEVCGFGVVLELVDLDAIAAVDVHALLLRDCKVLLVAGVQPACVSNCLVEL